MASDKGDRVTREGCCGDCATPGTLDFDFVLFCRTADIKNTGDFTEKMPRAMRPQASKEGSTQGGEEL
jgi:hypothetical protein